jgi:hypothetical protein
MAAAVPFIPAAIGIAGQILGGSKKSYQQKGTPQQTEAYNQLLQYLMSNMRTPSAGLQPTTDAMRLIYSSFFPKMGTTSTGMGTSPSTLPAYGSTNWMQSRRVG